MSSSRRRPLIVALAVAAVIATGCGGDNASPTGLGSGGSDDAAARGQDVAQQRGCSVCHSDNGDPGTGPTWKGIWGTTVQLDDGTAVADRDYVVRSIRDPDADVVGGFNPVMPTLNLSEGEIDDVVAYIESLGDTD
ncbi:MAG: c-type cytochrome [Acidimicrobiales bacterium]